MSRHRIGLTGFLLAVLVVLSFAASPAVAQQQPLMRWNVPTRGIGIDANSVFGLLSFMVDLNDRVTLQAIGWPAGDPMLGGGARYYWQRRAKWALFGMGQAGLKSTPGVDAETGEEGTAFGLGAVAGAGVQVNWPAIIGDDYPLLSSIHLGVGHYSTSLLSWTGPSLGASIHWRF